ncbi:nascent polypeptide-associated complex protein [Candidatus Woesearchaeota archaeon]|nr:nascent polypeptide-associated complex protein [Candidatus Woesearchaeota archaeon]
MFPGMNKRQVAQMMKKMGVQQVEIDARQVIILLDNEKIVIDNPQVSKVNMMGQQTYQIVGEERVESLDSTPEIEEDDISTVMEQTGVDEDKAKDALEKSKGDIAQAIMELSEQDQ